MSNENKPKRKPWEDENGNLLLDDELKIVSRSWSEKTWDDYLKTIETPQREVMLPNLDRVLLKRDAQQVVSEYAAKEASEESSLYLSPLAVRKALLELTCRQREIIDLIYFEDMNIEAAARKLRISRQAASSALSRSLERLKGVLGPQLEKKLKEMGKSL